MCSVCRKGVSPMTVAHQIRHTVRFAVPPRAIYGALMDSRQHRAFTGAPAKITESGCWVIWKANEQPFPGLPMRRPYEGQDGNRCSVRWGPGNPRLEFFKAMTTWATRSTASVREIVPSSVGLG